MGSDSVSIPSIESFFFFFFREIELKEVLINWLLLFGVYFISFQFNSYRG